MYKLRSDSNDSGTSEITLRSNIDPGPACTVLVDSCIIRKISNPTISYEANFENMLSYAGPFDRNAKVISESNPTSKYFNDII